MSFDNKHQIEAIASGPDRVDITISIAEGDNGGDNGLAFHIRRTDLGQPGRHAVRASDILMLHFRDKRFGLNSLMRLVAEVGGFDDITNTTPNNEETK